MQTFSSRNTKRMRSTWRNKAIRNSGYVTKELGVKCKAKIRGVKLVVHTVHPQTQTLPDSTAQDTLPQEDSLVRPGSQLGLKHQIINLKTTIIFKNQK